MAGKGSGAPGLEHAVDGDVVLDGDGHAVEAAQDSAVLEKKVALGSLFQSMVVPAGDCVDLGIDQPGILEKGGDNFG